MERQGTFADGLGGEEQRFADVLRLEVRVERKDVVRRLSLGDQCHDCRDWNSQPAQAGHSSHLERVDCHAMKLHTAHCSRRTSDLLRRTSHARCYRLRGFFADVTFADSSEWRLHAARSLACGLAGDKIPRTKVR